MKLTCLSLYVIKGSSSRSGGDRRARGIKGRQVSSSIHGREKLGFDFYRALTMQITLI